MTRSTWAIVVGSLTVIALALLAVGPGRPVDSVEERDVVAERTAEAAGEDQAATASTTTTAAPTTTATPADEVPLIDPGKLEGAAQSFAEQPSVDGVVPLVRSMAATRDRRWVPYVLDMRLLSNQETFDEVVVALEALTGEPRPDDPADVYLQYGRWLYNEAVDPGSAYVPWKARIFSLIDPLMEDMILSVQDPVLTAQIQWGGVRVGGIPELNDHPAITVAAADHMLEDELTFGAVINGRARAYPYRILDHHELANDTLGGEPVALANCTLCRTGVLYSRVVDGDVLDFITSGLLHNSNKVMSDMQTGSLWFQLTGEAIAGDLKGTVLERFPLTVAYYGEWVAEHPDTDVVDVPVGFGFSYIPGDAYDRYYGASDLWFPTYDVAPIFDPKQEVATLDYEGARLAVDVSALAGTGPRLLLVGDRQVAAVPTAVGVRFYATGIVVDQGARIVEAGLPATAVVSEDAIEIDGESWPRITSGQSFWFAWFGNYPDSRWWPEDGQAG